MINFEYHQQKLLFSTVLLVSFASSSLSTNEKLILLKNNLHGSHHQLLSAKYSNVMSKRRIKKKYRL